jgi:hypothetical protein
LLLKPGALQGNLALENLLNGIFNVRLNNRFQHLECLAVFDDISPIRRDAIAVLQPIRFKFAIHLLE